MINYNINRKNKSAIYSIVAETRELYFIKSKVKIKIFII